MKISTNTDNWDTTNAAKTITVDDEGMAKMVGLISKNIYSKPASAFREYWLNARESHQATGTTTPMTVILPGNDTTPSDDMFTVGNATISVNTSADHMFVIRDFGTGMDRNELKGMITSAGSSSKDNSDEFGGGMGIGSLSGFSVSDQIVFTAFKDGKRNTVILSAENSSWAMADETDTDEDNGVEVSFVVHPDKVAGFTRGAINYLNVNGYTDNMNLIIPDSEFDSIDNVAKHCNAGTISMEWATLRSVRGRNPQYGDNVLAKAKANPNNLTVRVDGCAYEGVIPDGVVFDPALAAVQWISDNVNNKANANESWNNLFYNCGGGFYTGGGARSYNVIVDVAVGKYSHEIQPSRETIALPKSDVQEIADVIAATVCNKAHEGMHIVSQYIDYVANGATVDMSTVVDWANQIQAMDNDTRVALMQVGALFPQVTMIVGSNSVGRVTLHEIARGDNLVMYTDSKVFSSDIDEAVGFVVAGDTMWKVTGLQVSHSGQVNTVRLHTVGEFEPSKINVVPTTAKKYNNDTMTKHITANDNDMAILFNTPVVAKLLNDDFFGAVFSDICDVEGVTTTEFKEWKKLNGFNAKESAPKDNVTYNCAYGGCSRFDVDCATIAQYANDGTVEKVIISRTYENRSAIRNYVKVFHNDDNDKIVTVNLDGRKKPEHAMKRLIAAGVDKDMIINAEELNNGNIIKVALDSVSDSEKEMIANIHLTRNINRAIGYMGEMSNKDFGMIVEAMGFGSQYATVRHLFHEGQLDNAKAHNTLPAFGMHVVDTLRDTYAEEDRLAIESQLSENLHNDVVKALSIGHAFSIRIAVNTFGIEKTAEAIKAVA